MPGILLTRHCLNSHINVTCLCVIWNYILSLLTVKNWSLQYQVDIDILKSSSAEWYVLNYQHFVHLNHKKYVDSLIMSIFFNLVSLFSNRFANLKPHQSWFFFTPFPIYLFEKGEKVQTLELGYKQFLVMVRLTFHNFRLLWFWTKEFKEKSKTGHCSFVTQSNIHLV